MSATVPPNERLRILQAVHFFLPRHYAGSELYTYRLCKELMKRHTVHLLFAEHNLANPQFHTRSGEYDGIPVTELTNNFHFDDFTGSYSDPRVDALFDRLVEQFRPDVVHFQHLLNLSIGMIKVARRHGIPAILTLHDYWLTCPSGGQRIRNDKDICEQIDLDQCSDCFRKSPFNASKLERTLFGFAQRLGPVAAQGLYQALNLARLHAPEISAAVAGDDGRDTAPSLVPQMAIRLAEIRRAIRDLDLMITPSQFARNVFIQFGVSPGKIICVPNGHVPFKPPARRTSSRLRVGFIGTIAPHKGVHILIEACRLLPAGDFDIRICGELTIFPGYVKELRARSDGLPVKFVGKVDNDRIGELFADLDVLVVPSIWWENSPLTVHEAFMAGVPVVAANIGGLPELVRSGENGFLFEPGNARDLASKLRLIREDPELLARLRERVPSVKTIEENARELVEIYRALIEARGQPIREGAASG